MKSFRKIFKCSAAVLFLSSLTGCAAGSATAAYSLKAREADYLSAQGEQRITERVKKEVLCELRDGCTGNSGAQQTH